jgi:hypothetical protein
MTCFWSSLAKLVSGCASETNHEVLVDIEEIRRAARRIAGGDWLGKNVETQELSLRTEWWFRDEMKIINGRIPQKGDAIRFCEDISSQEFFDHSTHNFVSNPQIELWGIRKVVGSWRYMEFALKSPQRITSRDFLHCQPWHSGTLLWKNMWLHRLASQSRPIHRLCSKSTTLHRFYSSDINLSYRT